MKRCLLVLLLMLSAGAHGALNKWVDADGEVHYSDQPPPPNVKGQTLSTPSAASGETAQKTFVEREAEWKKTRKAKEEAAQTAAQQQESAVVRQKNCEGAKANLKTFESNLPLTTYNEKGESIYMDDATRQKNIEEARKQIELYCVTE